MAQQQLQRYKLVPPKNLVRLHKSSEELGYPDFYPPRPGQDEDQMTEENVRKGFIDSPFVEKEHFSAHDMIYDELKNKDTLKNLGDFMSEVMKRKNETNSFQGSSQFTGPIIVWVTTEERDKWLRDLAGNASLKVLAKSVPKFNDGKEVLESVLSHRVPFARATWLTKIFGINKIIQNRGNSEYTKEWTSTFNQFIRDQISNHSELDKWRYSILLAKWQFDEQLLDQRLLRYTLDQLDQADHWQTLIWLLLVQQFLSEFQRSRTLMRLLIEIIIRKLQDIYQHTHIAVKLEMVTKILKNILQNLFITTPDMFVFPVCWNTYKDLLRRVLVEDISKKDSPNLKHQRELFYEMVRSRNEIFDDKKVTPLGMGNARDALHTRMINILDKITYHVDYNSIAAEYFRTDSKFQMMEREVSKHIYKLCLWAITPFRAGDFRVYSVSKILDIWKNGVSDDEKLERQTIVQSSLVEFLDDYPFGKNGINEQEESEAIARLFGVLTRNSHFSHQRYLQRLIARGDVMHEKRNSERSIRHLRYVKWFAIYETDIHDLNHNKNQRWHILYGINSKDTTDEKAFNTFTNIIAKKLPNIFSPKEDMNAPMVDDPVSDFNYSINFDDASVNFIQNATKFCQSRVIQEFLIPSVKNFVQSAPIDAHNWRNPTEPGSSLLNARQLVTVIQIIELTKDYISLLELIVWVLGNSMERSLFPLIIDTIKRHELIWEAMGKSDKVFDVLMKKNDQLREKRAIEICILNYLLNTIHDPGNEKKLKLEQDLLSSLKSPLSAAIYRHKDKLGEPVKKLLNNTQGFRISPNQIDTQKFQSENVNGYLYAILEACTDVIHYISKNNTSCNDDRESLDVLGDLLREVGYRTTDGFDTVFSKKWLNIYIRADDEDSVLKQDSTDRFLIFFTILVVRHLVKIETALEHLVEKNLVRFSHKLSNSNQLDSNELIECRNLAILLRILFIHKNVSSGIPLTTIEIQVLQSICESFIYSNNFTIISSVFQKLAIIESLLGPENDLAIELRQLRIDFGQVYWFKQLCISNIDNVYDRFIKGTKKQNISKDVKKRMIEIVRLGLGNFFHDSDVMSDHSSLSSTLKELFSTVNLWNIQKIRIEFYMYMDQIMLLESSNNESSSNMELDGDLIMGGTGNDFSEIKSKVIEYFWEELVLKGNNDCLTISHIIRGIREDVAAELMEHGLKILERCGKLITGIEEVFRSLLLSVGEGKKYEFGETLLSQIQKIIEENGDTFVSCVMARIRLFILVANVVTARVTAVVTSVELAKVKQNTEYILIMKWVITLINLLCSERIHQNGGGADNFELILDLVSFLFDEMGKNTRAVIVSELKPRYRSFNIPVIWSNRIKRVLPLNIPKETLGKMKHELDAWQLIEGIGENDDLNNSAIDLSWYDAKFYQKPSKRLKRTDECEDYNLDFNKKYNEECGNHENHNF